MGSEMCIRDSSYTCTSVVVFGATVRTWDQSVLFLAVQPGRPAKSNEGTNPAAVVVRNRLLRMLARLLIVPTSQEKSDTHQEM